MPSLERSFPPLAGSKTVRKRFHCLDQPYRKLGTLWSCSKEREKNTHNGPGVEDNLQRAQRITQSLPNLVRLLGSVESLDLSSADLGTDCAALADRDGTCVFLFCFFSIVLADHEVR